MFTSNTALPDRYRSGLPADVQKLFRGYVNGFIMVDELQPEEALSKAEVGLTQAGWTFTGKAWRNTDQMAQQKAALTKSDERQQVFGWANVAITKDGETVVDSQDDFFDDVEEFEKMAYGFVLKSRRGGELHMRDDVATMIESVVFTPEKLEKLGLTGHLPVGWWVGFQVHDADVWDRVRNGDYKGFSIGGKGTRTPVEVS